MNKAGIDKIVETLSSGNEYEFHEDWDISSVPHLSETRVSKARVKAFFREDVERTIPAEHRKKVKYGCRRRCPYHRRFEFPFIIWWLYPGKQFKQAKVVFGKTQEAVE